MSKDSSNSNNRIGLFGLLGVAFIVLKLTNVIDWSWWWVTLPLWGGFAIVLLILAIMGIVVLIMNASDGRQYKQTAPPKVRKSNFQQRLDEMAEARGMTKPTNEDNY